MDHLERGQHVRHATRPEWGIGEIEKAEPFSQDGAEAQRLAIRFSRAGLKRLLTSHAPIEVVVPAEVLPDNADEAVRRLTQLPDAATDPFSTPLRRLEATLAEYRFSDSGTSLLDWAAARTALDDPLQMLRRTDLESAWSRYQDARDTQLRRTLKELRLSPPENPAALAEIIREAPEPGRNALQRVHAAR